MIKIRPERPDDITAIHGVNEEAFGEPTEAKLVDTLRATCPGGLSLVALAENEIVGHILFTPVTVQCEKGEVRGMGLAPMAVLPEHQRRGIGSRLVETGLERLRRQGCPFVIVLGQKVAVKLGIPIRTHVRDVDIANSAICLFSNVAPVVLHPVPIANGAFCARRLDADRARRAAVFLRH